MILQYIKRIMRRRSIDWVQRRYVYGVQHYGDVSIGRQIRLKKRIKERLKQRRIRRRLVYAMHKIDGEYTFVYK